MLKSVFYSRTASAVAAWLAIGTAVIGGLLWLTPAWVGTLSVAQILLLGFGLSVVALLLVAASVALFAHAFRKIRPLPSSAADQAVVEDLERTKERLKRAEERLDGAKVVEGVARASNKTMKLTGAERERASEALCEIVDFVGVDLPPLCDGLRASDSDGPWSVIDAAERLEPARDLLSARATELWHKHSYYLDLLDFDIMPLLQTLQALKNPMEDAIEARGWPANAQADRARPIAQLMSDLGGHIGNVRRDAAEKRREYLE